MTTRSSSAVSEGVGGKIVFMKADPAEEEKADDPAEEEKEEERAEDEVDQGATIAVLRVLLECVGKKPSEVDLVSIGQGQHEGNKVTAKLAAETLQAMGTDAQSSVMAKLCKSLAGLGGVSMTEPNTILAATLEVLHTTTVPPQEASSEVETSLLEKFGLGTIVSNDQILCQQDNHTAYEEHNYTAWHVDIEANGGPISIEDLIRKEAGDEECMDPQCKRMCPVHRFFTSIPPFLFLCLGRKGGAQAIQPEVQLSKYITLALYSGSKENFQANENTPNMEYTVAAILAQIGGRCVWFTKQYGRFWVECDGSSDSKPIGNWGDLMEVPGLAQGVCTVVFKPCGRSRGCTIEDLPDAVCAGLQKLGLADTTREECLQGIPPVDKTGYRDLNGVHAYLSQKKVKWLKVPGISNDTRNELFTFPEGCFLVGFLFWTEGDNVREAAPLGNVHYCILSADTRELIDTKGVVSLPNGHMTCITVDEKLKEMWPNCTRVSICCVRLLLKMSGCNGSDAADKPPDCVLPYINRPTSKKEKKRTREREQRKRPNTRGKRGKKKRKSQTNPEHEIPATHTRDEKVAQKCQQPGDT